MDSGQACGDLSGCSWVMWVQIGLWVSAPDRSWGCGALICWGWRDWSLYLLKLVISGVCVWESQWCGPNLASGQQLPGRERVSVCVCVGMSVREKGGKDRKQKFQDRPKSIHFLLDTCHVQRHLQSTSIPLTPCASKVPLPCSMPYLTPSRCNIIFYSHTHPSSLLSWLY